MSEPIRKSLVFRPDRSRAYGTIGLIGAAALWLYFLSSAMPDGTLAQIVRIAVALVALVLGLVVVQTTLNLAAGRLSIELTETDLILREPAERRIARADITGASVDYDRSDANDARRVIVTHLAGEGEARAETKTALPFPYASNPEAILRAIQQWAPRAREASALTATERLKPKTLPAAPPVETARADAPALETPALQEQSALPKIPPRTVFGLKT